MLDMAFDLHLRLRVACGGVIFALCAPAAAQSVPAANFTDMWWNPAESGWGVSIVQHPSHQVYAVWYTYDPRELAANGQYRPMWIVMSGGTWTSPTVLTGNAYVTSGVPFNQAGGKTGQNAVGTFTFRFSDANHGTFTYSIAGAGSGNEPGAGLPAFSGTKAITRQSF
jgi:lysyl endopeptidase